MLLAPVVGLLDRRQQEAIAYVIEENRILRSHLSGRIRLTDEERRRVCFPDRLTPKGRLLRVDDRTDAEGARRAARARAADVVAGLSTGALGRDRRRGLLHDRSLDVAGFGDLVHGVCHRPGVSVSNSLSRCDWELNEVPAVGDPTHMVQIGKGHRVSTGESQWRPAVQ
jgi:hypothetical protein